MNASQGHDDPDPVTDRVHANSWSANLERPADSEARELLLEGAVDAVEHTAAGHHVNLVTHGDHGHPEGYLFAALEAAFVDDVDYEYVEQCCCGGHATRVHVGS